MTLRNIQIGKMWLFVCLCCMQNGGKAGWSINKRPTSRTKRARHQAPPSRNRDRKNTTHRGKLFFSFSSETSRAGSLPKCDQEGMFLSLHYLGLIQQWEWYIQNFLHPCCFNSGLNFYEWISINYPLLRPRISPFKMGGIGFSKSVCKQTQISNILVIVK